MHLPNQTINMYNDIIQFLDEHRLKEALTQLHALTSEAEDWQLQSKAENLQTTYGYMLQYAAQGMQDPEQGKLYEQLRRAAYELADQTELVRKTLKGNGYFANAFRNARRNPHPSYKNICIQLEGITEDFGMAELNYMQDEKQLQAAQLDIATRHANSTDTLFSKAWVSLLWEENDFNEANELMQSLLVPVLDLAVMISGVTLSLLQLFDPKKFQFLLQTYQSRSEHLISQRALIGIALVAYYQEKRLALYPELQAALSLFSDDAKVIEQLTTIQILFLLSRETEKIDKKMREEIIPKMMRNTKMQSPDFKIEDIEDLEDKNPEWEEDLNQVQKSIQELGELQMEGADTYMGTFAQLKSFPFFRQIAHWFYPFDRQVPDIIALFNSNKIAEKSMINILLQSPIFCNSDKYSFCLATVAMPESQLQMLGSELPKHDDLVYGDFDKLNAKIQKADNTDTSSRQYIHDLYRFYKLWMYRNEQTDIFKTKLALWNCQALAPLLQQQDTLKKIAGHLFSKDYMEEAAELYEKLIRTEPDNADLWQRLGFSLQKQKKYAEAVKAYMQADILRPDHIWTLKHLAQCHKRMHAYEQALEYFRKVEEMQPDNLNLLLQIGQCLATLRLYDKALSYFFKVEYLEKAPENAQRAIGWCYFMTGEYEKALNFYQKLLHSASPQTNDYLNAGHVYTALQNIPQAIECYRKAEKQCSTHEEFIKLYLADKEALIEQHIPTETIYLMPDLL